MTFVTLSVTFLHSLSSSVVNPDISGNASDFNNASSVVRLLSLNVRRFLYGILHTAVKLSVISDGVA